MRLLRIGKLKQAQQVMCVEAVLRNFPDRGPQYGFQNISILIIGTLKKVHLILRNFQLECRHTVSSPDHRQVLQILANRFSSLYFLMILKAGVPRV